jgi:rhodanese-related sulfurtransferase
MFPFPFWNSNSDKIKKIGFEDMKYALENPARFILINTLSNDDQDILIKTTIASDTEETVLNELLNDFQKDEPIIVYGRNACDNSVEKKYKQLINLGFDKVYMYVGGMFEWVLLQDVYGFAEFPTNRKVADILRYKPANCIR